MDWAQAAQHLQTCIAAYKEAGPPGVFALTFTIYPALARFDAGERSQALYDMIMNIAL